MCGRFKRDRTAAEIGERFGVAALPESGQPENNIAPTQPVPVIVNIDDGQSVRRRMVIFRWGLIPHWAKDPAIGSRLINARAETLAGKPSFREALMERRCLVPATGFYEWPKSGPLAGQMIEVRRVDAGLFAFAGLWESWRAPDGEWRRTFTIITVPPNELISPHHDRMPAILTRGDEGAWIDPATDWRTAQRLLRSHPVEELMVVAVDRERWRGATSRAGSAPDPPDNQRVERGE
jgi:putative SOS response-associated peptidase YedK